MFTKRKNKAIASLNMESRSERPSSQAWIDETRIFWTVRHFYWTIWWKCRDFRLSGKELSYIEGHGPHVSTNGRYFPTPEPQLHSLSPHFPHTLSLSLEGRTREGKDELEWESGEEEDGEENQDCKGWQDQHLDQALELPQPLISWLAHELSVLIILRSIPKP